jgi:hypothetical protein
MGKPGRSAPSNQKVPALPTTPRPPGLEKGDHVYAQHPKKGPLAVEVKCTGKHGFVGVCGAGEAHRLTYDTYLGHKSRMLHTYAVADQGADGALLENASGRRRYLQGFVTTPAPGAAPGPGNARDREEDDPLRDGLDRITKALVDIVLPDFVPMRSAPRPMFLLRRPAPVSHGDAAAHAASAIDWNARIGKPPTTSPVDIVGRYRDDHGLQWTDEDCQTVAHHVERAHLLSGETNEPTEATPEGVLAWNAPPEQPPVMPRLSLPKRPAPR